MKILIKNTTILLLPLLATLSCTSQMDLSRAVSESKNQTRNLSYIDSSGNGYEKGLVDGIRMDVIFRSIKFNKKTKLVKVNGRTTVFANEKDTVGLCCVDYFIALPMGRYLTKIRRLGKTNSHQVENTTLPDGYFSFEIKLNKSDQLYFVGSDGSGLEEYNLGRVSYEVSASETKLPKK